MDILASIGNFIIFQVLDQAPIFLGIITLVGLLLQKPAPLLHFPHSILQVTVFLG